MSAHISREGSGMSSEVYARHFEGVPDHRIVLAREGVNTHCVDCWGTPLTGGLRCLTCFGKVAVPKSGGGKDGRCGTVAGHSRHIRRGEKACRPCLDENAEKVRRAYWAKKTERAA